MQSEFYEKIRAEIRRQISATLPKAHYADTSVMVAPLPKRPNIIFVNYDTHCRMVKQRTSDGHPFLEFSPYERGARYKGLLVEIDDNLKDGEFEVKHV